MVMDPAPPTVGKSSRPKKRTDVDDDDDATSQLELNSGQSSFPLPRLPAKRLFPVQIRSEILVCASFRELNGVPVWC